MKSLIIGMLSALVLSLPLKASEWSQLALPSWDAVKGEATSAWNGASDLLGGFASGFGYCSPSNTYGLKIWNDIPAPIEVVIQNFTEFMGAELAGIPVAAAKMQPMTNTGSGMAALGGICSGAVYMLPSSDTATVSYANYLFAGQQEGLSLGGAGGTTVFVLSDVTNIFVSLAGTLTGATPIAETVLKNKAFYTRDFTATKKTDITEVPVYHYHAYFHKGKSYGELLNAEYTKCPPGIAPCPTCTVPAGFPCTVAGDSTEFAGVFFNSSATDAKLTFLKDEKQYNVTLEALSFNTLNSTTGQAYSIRPPEENDSQPLSSRRAFSFTLGSKTATLPISSIGMGDKTITDDSGTFTSSPKVYTYEIFDGTNGQDIGIQGVQIGNYDQVGVDFEASKTALIAKLPNLTDPDNITQWSTAVTSLIAQPPYTYPLLTHIRDINPVHLSIWPEDAATINAELASDPAYTYDTMTLNPFETYWIYYKTADSTILQTLVPGQIAELDIFRPQIKEKEASLYIFSLNTSDKNKAQQFFNNLFITAVPQSYYSTINAATVVPEVSALLPDLNGVINDSASGVMGRYLLKDVFKSTGMGAGPFYYTIMPPYLLFSNLVNVLASMLNETVNSSPQAVKDTVFSWITYFYQNKTQIEALGIKNATDANIQNAIPSLTSYLNLNGTDTVKSNLNAALYSMIYGPTSISKLPLIWQAGSNGFTTKPSNWPQSIAQ